MKNRSKWIAAISAVIFMIVGRCFWESRAEMNAAAAYLTQKKTDEAVLHLDRAIHWYFPLNPYIQPALEKLWNIGTEFENKDRKMALLAFDAIRGSLFSIRHVGQPYSNWISKANGKIAFLRAQEEAERRPGESIEKWESYHRELLEKDERPRSIWVLIIGVGFVGWVTALFLGIWKGFDAQGKMNVKKLMPYLIASGSLFLIWIVGLLKA